ncbi:glutamine-dependent NAD(+) synthetase [Orbilia oligospora]|uniref:Glutamine-dependent NAD(+) synthetase n=1 Tax=Orbilia oligospora TaxID=2813651 RepID=A0A7C8PVZ2_ORBOL|nr:glutamine-dependent NAD(+) synthetase [Orbilia oligospora]KAF3194394.1 glutamine-dependent NAD(+) synthetase [Orbilia oligospora]KAF3246183.1 glutamine-dependent NAD(+) synthetase [Orbilia oligospora]KAF3264145.1 glutamine-dependent NAD(+) synthetase [Orbilia oligospora]KAF3296103.1 glutamine-dependent NAD(+) synthetase [Orbilia oligospora]
MRRFVSVSVCSLNQWAGDWIGNCDRIKESIRRSKAAGASLRVGPELEICGSDCLDSFFEDDLYLHSWEMLGCILADRECHDIFLCIGMPVKHGGKRYNSKVFALDGKILLIAPQTIRWSDQNSRDGKYFSLWKKRGITEEYRLPDFLKKAHGTGFVPFGDSSISVLEGSIGPFVGGKKETSLIPDISIHTTRYHHEIGRFASHMDSICRLGKNVGGVHIYSNLKGCGGERMLYEGASCIIVNGEVIAQGPRFKLGDVDVITATVDLQKVDEYRCSILGHANVQLLGKDSGSLSYVDVPFSLASPNTIAMNRIATGLVSITDLPKVHFTEAEEIAVGPACWLWDYLRRAGMNGFLCPLSGGIDSCSTAIVVYVMCHLVIDAIKSGDCGVINDVQKMCATTDRSPDWLPATPNELCNNILHTVYMCMPEHSSAASEKRARELRDSIGAYHLEINIEDGYKAQKDLITSATGYQPIFQVFGGSRAEDICLQNIQARLRMVTAYQFGQILPVSRKRVCPTPLLILASTNADEVLRGNYTRYDCSSADLNPIGSYSKNHLREMIGWAQHNFNLPVLQTFLDAKPSGELQPITKDYCQDDEGDLGMSYDELAMFAISRKIEHLGAVSMFQKHVQTMAGDYTPQEMAEKIKKFHYFLALNRHKSTTLTPAYHATSYSPHNNWCDSRQFLFPFQNTGHTFQKIDDLTALIEKREYQNQLNAAPIMAKL